MSIISCIIVSFIPLCTSFIFLLGPCLNGPGWTVCTLSIMWLIFPFSLQSLRQLSNENLYTYLIRYFYLQMGLILVLFVPLLLTVGYWPAFAAATMNPLSRYPVFLMGVYAGELSRRISLEESYDWPSSLFSWFPSCCFDATSLSSYRTKPATGEVSYWKSRVDSLALSLLYVTLAVCFSDALVRYLGGASDGFFGGVWYQAIVPFIQLELIVALTRDNGESVTSKVFRHSLFQWLGKLSLCIYLIHLPVMRYLLWIIHGARITWPDEMDCEEKYDEDDALLDKCEHDLNQFNSTRALPLWGMPIVWVVSLLLSWIVHHAIEEPARKCLRITKVTPPHPTTVVIN
jgi:peptidoglycan/LPS O-acetylase OafA/YrhL